MNHVRLIGVLSIGFMVIGAALMLALTPGAAQAVTNVARPMPALQGGRTPDSVPTAPFTCTLTAETHSTYANTSFDTAVELQFSITDLALFDGITNTEVVVQRNYFQLNNPIPNNAYNVSAVPDGIGNYNLGIIVYDSARRAITGDQNPLDNNSASVTVVPSTTSPLFFEVLQLVKFASQKCSGTYHLTASQTAPTSTPTTTPTPTKTTTPTKTQTGTPAPFACATGVDALEPNDSFDTASTLGLGDKKTGLNFVECVSSEDGWDNDYFRIHIKSGMLLQCQTSDPAPGTDTNLILYDDNRNGIDGNDDVDKANGDLSSRVKYYSTYDGWLYALVGEGFHRSTTEQAATKYSFACNVLSQSTATPTIEPTPAPGVPTRTPVPPTPTITLTPSPTLSPTPPFIRIQPLPTVTPAGPPLTNIPISLLVYYDANGNNKPDPGEGVSQVSARVYDLVTGGLLDQKLTDETGRASFTVSAPGAVQLVVPYLDFTTIILPSGGSAVIRVSGRDLPQSIP
jgi:hypothetical protein